jgi:Uma2 family endonuclease
MLIREYTPLSEEEYLRLEARSPVRHEYVRGEVFAMTGGTLRHNTIALNLAAALRAHLRSSPCRVFINDVRVRAEKANAYYYSDVLVSCARDSEPVDLTAATVHDPVLIIEVLSPATDATDRREKLLAYRTITSLTEYVLVSQDDARVEIHRRGSEIGWQKLEYAGPESVELTSVGLQIDMGEIYEGVPIESLMRARRSGGS